MKTKTVLFTLCAMLIACVAQAQDATATITMKPGLWEMRIQTKETGKTENDSKERQPMRKCVTPEDTKGATEGFIQPLMSICGAQPEVNSSGNRTTYEVSCKKDNPLKVEADSLKIEVIATDELFTGKIEKTNATDPDAKQTFEVQLQLISSDCGNGKNSQVP